MEKKNIKKVLGEDNIIGRYYRNLHFIASNINLQTQNP